MVSGKQFPNTRDTVKSLNSEKDFFSGKFLEELSEFLDLFFVRAMGFGKFAAKKRSLLLIFAQWLRNVPLLLARHSIKPFGCFVRHF
jgi:hypothetical protein